MTPKSEGMEHTSLLQMKEQSEIPLVQAVPVSAEDCVAYPSASPNGIVWIDLPVGIADLGFTLAGVS